MQILNKSTLITAVQTKLVFVDNEDLLYLVFATQLLILKIFLILTRT